MASLYNYDLMHHHHQQIPQTAISQYPHFTHTEWLQGWRRWAESRKRGKMAQFIVELLEKGASGHWLDITAGKFELTEWHAIAQFWYKKKKRASDPTDAPCMLRKGLPRAFPNLREVKSDSVKDGTQYKSRVFQCPPELVQEVIQIMSGQGSYQLIHNPLAAFNGGESSEEDEQPTEGWPDEMSDMNDLTSMMLGGPPQQQNGYISPQLSHSDHIFDQQIKKEQQMWNSSFVASPASFGTSPSHSPQYPIPDQQQQPINGHGGMISHDQWIQQQQQSQPITGDVNNLYNSHLSENILEVPAPLTPASTDSRRSSLGRNGTLQTTYPNSPQRNSPQMIASTSQMISHAQMMTSSLTQIEQPPEPVLMPIKLVPNKSPLEGGGELAVVFAQGFPDGPKTILYVSHQNPSYSYRCDATQENAMTLSVIIPGHPIAEEVDVQVYCNNQLIARAPFAFYQGANYEVAQMLQFINQYMPQFLTPGFNPNVLGGNSSGSQEGFSQGNGNYNYGNPAYMLLVGACKSGIEPLVRALLQIPGVGPLLAAPIPGHDGGINVAELAKRNGHITISNCIKDLINHSVITARLPSGDDPVEKLEKGGNTPQQSARCVLHALKAVRDGEDPASAIKNFVRNTTNKPTKVTVVDTENEINRLSGDISKIVVSEDATIPSKNDAAVTPDASNDSARVAEIEALKEENEKLKELFESMREQHKAKDRECRMLSQERDRLYKKITDLEGELEDNIPTDHVGVLCRAQSDMTIMPKIATARGGLNLPNKPRLTRQNRSIDPHKNPPLAFTQTWLSKESGISLSMEEEVSNYTSRRRSSLLSLMSERGEGNEITLLYPSDEARTVADSLYFDTMHIITEDWPMTENVKMFKVGERLLEIDGQSLRDKTFDEVLELLKQPNSEDDSRKKILKQTMPPILATIASDIDLDASKIDSLLSHSPPNARQITLSRTSDDLPFKLAGGNAVGLFITEATLDGGIIPGDQIIQINGRGTADMTYEEAMTELKLSTQFNLEVIHNHQAWESQRLQRRFELDSAVYKCQSSYSPEKDNTASMKDSMKEMELTPGTMVHVINTSLYEESGYWLAWKLSPEGHKVALKKIPSALKAKELYGDVGKLYERISLPIYGQ